MNLRIPPAILNATRLVRAGNLAEATRAIQHALQGSAAETAVHPIDARGEAIEGSYRVIDGRAPTAREDRFVTRSYSNGAGTREYKVFVPAVDGDDPLPVVVMLHGCKQGSEEFAASTQMNALARRHGFIAVYPQQCARANVSKCWNWFDPGHQHRGRGEPSLIAGLTHEVLDEFRAETRKVYVAGLSAGGAMAAVMAATYPDVYAAVGIHSGLAYRSALNVASAFAAMRGADTQSRVGPHADMSALRRVPAIVFHGDSDDTVNPKNADALVTAAAAADKARFENAAGETLDRCVERGRAGGRDYTRIVFRDAGGTSFVEQWTVHGAGHAWVGGAARAAYTDATGPDASSEMLRFFFQHSRVEQSG